MRARGERAREIERGPRERTGQRRHCGNEAGSYLRLIDACITQLKAEELSRTCNGSKEEEEAEEVGCEKHRVVA